MQRLASSTLEDPVYRVPEAPPGESGMAWVRANVPRFCEGDEHAVRRARVEAVLAEIADVEYTGSPTRTLLAALGLLADLEPDVALASAAYQPHAPQSSEADAAADRLVEACGGRGEQAAARVCVLVQADAACRVLADRIRTGSDEPPLAATRRVTPDGDTVEVDLADAHFGHGPHRCPGEKLATRLAHEAAVGPAE